MNKIKRRIILIIAGILIVSTLACGNVKINEIKTAKITYQEKSGEELEKTTGKEDDTTTGPNNQLKSDESNGESEAGTTGNSETTTIPGNRDTNTSTSSNGQNKINPTTSPTTRQVINPTTEPVTQPTTEYVASTVKQKIEQVISQYVTSSMSVQEKIKVIHDWMVKNIYYDTSLTYFSAEDGLLRGTCVCQGYMEAFKLFMDKLGIECRLVIGEAGNQPHGWNAVKLSDGWYYVDVTWDDPLMNGHSNYKNGENISYDYFLVTETVMSMTHVTDNESKITSGNGSSNKYNQWAKEVGTNENIVRALESYKQKYAAEGTPFVEISSTSEIAGHMNTYINNKTSGKLVIFYRASTGIQWNDIYLAVSNANTNGSLSISCEAWTDYSYVVITK